MEKIYRVQMNKNGMPNFATAEEVADRPKGEWKVISKTTNTTLVSCSECGKRFHIPNYCFNSERSRWKCCPICLADMRKREGE